MIAQSALHPPTSDSGLIVPCGIIYPSLSFKKLVDGPISSIYQQLNDDHNNSVVVCSHIFWKPICQNDDKRAPHHLVLYSPLFLIQYKYTPLIFTIQRNMGQFKCGTPYEGHQIFKQFFLIFQKNACWKDYFAKERLLKRSFSKRLLILVKSDIKW